MAAPSRFELDRLFYFGNRGVQVLQAGERIRQENLRLYIPRRDGERLFRTNLGVVKASAEEQHAARSDLYVRSIEQYVGRPHEFLGRLRTLASLHVGVGELQAQLAVLWVDLQRISEFESGLRHLALGEVAIAALDIAIFGNPGIARAASGNQTDEDGEAGRQARKPHLVFRGLTGKHRKTDEQRPFRKAQVRTISL